MVYIQLSLSCIVILEDRIVLQYSVNDKGFKLNLKTNTEKIHNFVQPKLLNDWFLIQNSKSAQESMVNGLFARTHE